jgi:hypothetical protein
VKTSFVDTVYKDMKTKIRGALPLLILSLVTGCASDQVNTAGIGGNTSMLTPTGLNYYSQNEILDIRRMQSQLNARNTQPAGNPYWSKQTFIQMQPMMRMHR